MAEFNEQSNEPRDYKERFEFELTYGNNIICRRYFRINNFNPVSLKSYELTAAIRRCVNVIDSNLKDKTQTYLEMCAPKVFNSKEEMDTYFKNPENAKAMHLGEGIVIRGCRTTDYVWTKNGPEKLSSLITESDVNSKFDNGELSESSAEDNKVTYKFAFKVDGREVSSMIWDGYYPRFISGSNRIDLSNKKGKFEGEDVDRLSYEQYLLYKMSQGKSDLVYGIIRDICRTCSYSDSKAYTTAVDGIIEGWNRSSQEALWRVR